MKKLLATTALTAGLALSGFSVEAAEFKSYYDFASTLNSTSQVSFVNRIVLSYETSNKIYKNFIDKYQTRYSQYSWFQNMVDRYNFQVEEISRLKSLLGDTGLPTVVDTQVVATPKTIVTTGTPVEVDSNNTVEVEREGNIVREYAVVTKTFETAIRTIYYDYIQTIKTWSNGSKTTEVTSKVTDVTNVKETNTTTERTLIREYAEVQPTTGGSVILTEEEYLARDDVNYAQGDVYREAVRRMNPNINDDYARNVLGGAYGNNLDRVGAPAAWSRGYTGKGSTIAILDTGIDIDHQEFVDRIIATECFTRACDLGVESIDDLNRYSHGTHVAGIAAAALDGNGTTGVAPDANLLIAKVATNSGFYDFNQAGRAISWAVERGADVVNMSGNYNVDNIYKQSVVSVGDGVYRSNDTRGQYATLGYTNLMSKATFRGTMEQAMAGNEVVAVMAAGNQGLDYPTFPAHYAVATEADGSLSFGGRIIVAGNWDDRSGTIARTSNRAGTMCFEFKADGSCASNYRISDFYIMAPGQYVASTVNGGEYMTLSGTSMAAPTVAGGVAVLHQMWPHMTGANLVKLMMNTGDKSFAGYNENIHGQGIMDLDAATLPQGALGIPTTGRAEGTTVNVSSGTMALGNVSISSLGDVMVLDDYDRDFYIDAGSLAATADTRTANPTKAAQAGFVPDYYMGYGAGQVVPMDNMALNIDDTANNMSLAYQLTNEVNFGMVSESGKFLGNVANNALMRVDGATTFYVGYSAEYTMGDTTLFGGASLGVTQLDVGSNSMLKSASAMISNSATIGTKTQIGGNSTLGFVASIPVAITSGNATFNMASSISADGTVNYSSTSTSLAAGNREIDYGVFYDVAMSDMTTVSSYAELRTNYAGSMTDSVTAGVKLEIRF